MQTAEIWWAEQIRLRAVSVTRRFARLSPEHHQPRYQDSERALDLGMAKEQLDGPQIAGAAIDHGGLGPPQGMRAEQARIETDAAYPVANKPRILPGREAPVSAPITLIYPDSAFRLYVGFWAQSRHPNALSRCPLSGE